jgi:hypothetical protein
MKFKEEESMLMWESFRSPEPPKLKKKNPYDGDFEDEDFGMDDFADDDMDDGFEDDAADFANDGLDDEFGDEMDGSMVLEFEPEAPIKAVTQNNEVLVSELKKLSEYASKLYGMKDQEFDDWMVSAITIASTYVSDVFHRMDAKQDLNGGFEQENDFSEF